MKRHRTLELRMKRNWARTHPNKLSPYRRVVYFADYAKRWDTKQALDALYFYNEIKKPRQISGVDGNNGTKNNKEGEARQW